MILIRAHFGIWKVATFEQAKSFAIGLFNSMTTSKSKREVLVNKHLQGVDFFTLMIKVEE